MPGEIEALRRANGGSLPLGKSERVYCGLNGKLPPYENAIRQGKVSAFVEIMRGCDNYCTYCVVPYVRGGERSRAAADLEQEVRGLIGRGFRQVVLIGQNVNSYHDGEYDFADLIRMVANIAGIKRVRFATSHPKDLSKKLIDTIARHQKICNHLHLPVQSGSDKILKLMNKSTAGITI